MKGFTTSPTVMPKSEGWPDWVHRRTPNAGSQIQPCHSCPSSLLEEDPGRALEPSDPCGQFWLIADTQRYKYCQMHKDGHGPATTQGILRQEKMRSLQMW